MSTRSNETIWPGLIFIWTIWAFSTYPLFESYAFPAAIVLWFVGVAATRLFSSAAQQLGFTGWLLIVQVAICYGLFLQFAPREVITKILLLWGVATPLLLVGSVWRRAYERFPSIRPLMNALLFALGCAACVAVPVIAWKNDGAFFSELLETAVAGALGWLFLYYGWRLAAPPPSGTYDARFGTQDSFQRAGVSNER